MPGNGIVLIIILVALGALCFAASFLISAYIPYKQAFKRQKHPRDPMGGLDSPKYAPYADDLRRIVTEISEEPYERVEIKAYDGISLVGRYYHRQDGAPIHLLFHGYKSTPLRDGAGGGCDSRDMGHNLLLVHQRAHGESGGLAISFGIRERYDVIAWANYLTERFGKECEIILIGVSMGASSAIMAAGLGLPDSVRCVIADCPFATRREVLTIGAARRGVPSRFAYPLMALGAGVFGGFSLKRSPEPLEAIRNSQIPILIMHGESDTVSPVSMAHSLHEAARGAGVDCTLLTFEGAEHCLAFMKDHERYANIRNEFLAKHLPSMKKKNGEG